MWILPEFWIEYGASAGNPILKNIEEQLIELVIWPTTELNDQLLDALDTAFAQSWIQLDLDWTGLLCYNLDSMPLTNKYALAHTLIELGFSGADRVAWLYEKALSARWIVAVNWYVAGVLIEPDHPLFI